MPMYDFECEKCGTASEHYLSPSHADDVLPCSETDCGGSCKRIPSFWYSSPMNAQHFAPVVIHRDANGEIRIPAHANAPVPAGYRREELTTIHDVRRVEREINAKDAVKSANFQAIRQEVLGGQLKANREAVRDIYHKLSPQGREFYDAMRKQSEARQSRGVRKANPAAYFEAFSLDASNREPHRDATNDWGRSGDRK